MYTRYNNRLLNQASSVNWGNKSVYPLLCRRPTFELLHFFKVVS